MSMQLFQYAELAACFMSLLLAGRLWSTSFVWFIPYLAVVVMVDIAANYFPAFVYGTNQWRFNLYLPVQYLFFSYLFWKHLASWRHRQIVLVASTVVMLFYFANLLWVQGFTMFNSNSFILGGVAIILYSNLYFLELVQKEDDVSIFSMPMFWTGIACLVFFIGFSVFFAVYFYYEESAEALREHRVLYSFINRYVITLHYILLMVAMVLHKKTAYV